jgi:SAM-dependent methyltransferase
MRGLEQIPWLYDLGMGVLERAGLGRWRAWVARGARGRTLDLGAGTGRTLPLYGAGVRPVAVDPHRDALARARARAPLVPAVVARAEALPFRDGVFDTVVAALVLCSVDHPDLALSEARRVLRPGGALRLMEHVRTPGAVGAVQDVVQPAWTTLSGGCRPNRDTEAAVLRAGFRLVPGTRRARGAMLRLAASPPDQDRGLPSDPDGREAPQRREPLSTVSPSGRGLTSCRR